MRATVGGGTVVAGGSIALDGMTPKSVRITLQGTDVAIRYYEGLTVEGELQPAAQRRPRARAAHGDVDVTRALYFKDFDIQQTLLNALLARNRVTPVAAATWQDRVGLRVHLSAPDTLAVQQQHRRRHRQRGARRHRHARQSGGPRRRDARRRRHACASRTSTTASSRGTIAFQNPFRIDPFFDVTVEGTRLRIRRRRRPRADRIDVTVNVTGTLDRITPTDHQRSARQRHHALLDSRLRRAGRPHGAISPARPCSASRCSTKASARSSARASSRSSTRSPTTRAARHRLRSRREGDVREARSPTRCASSWSTTSRTSRAARWWSGWSTRAGRCSSRATRRDEYRLDARFRRRYEAHWELGRGTKTTSPRRHRSPAAPATAAPAAPVIAPAAALTTVDPDAAGDAPIAQINFRADAGFDTSAVAQEVTLKPGQPVTIRELQSSIKNLFATGNFRDIRVDATRNGDGVVLTFSLYLHYRVGDIVFDRTGARRSHARAARAYRPCRRDPLPQRRRGQRRRGRRNCCSQHGYLEATVDPETNFDRARNTADVIVPRHAGTAGEDRSR